MHQLLRSLVIAALVCPVFGPVDGIAGSASDCRQSAMDHLRASRDGSAIYEQISNRDFFKSMINCNDAQFDLSTAVHESTHFITAQTDAFPLVGGGSIKRPHEVSAFFPPSRIAKHFKTDEFVTIYLRSGRASSSTDFLYLLDELNAYSHDLKTATDLKALTSAGEFVDHRDGLAALMAFVATYAQTAQESEPATWSGLQQPQVARTIAELWGRAEHVMASSCGIPNFGTEDKTYIQTFCARTRRGALEQLLGRPLACPTACLGSVPDITQASDTVPENPQPAVLPRRPADAPSADSSSWVSHLLHLMSGTRDPATSDASTAE